MCFLTMHLHLCLLLSFLLVAASSNSLVWHNITQAIERGALCNDFSPAGYFIRKNHPTSSNSTTQEEDSFTRWVIFLESGGGCTSPKSCNERFIQQNIRKQYTQTVNGSKCVNVTQAWTDYSSQPLIVTSTLMTSIWRFSEQYRAKNSKLWQVEGRDLLSTDQHENPDFYLYNHVLIPYCSSDLWLKKTRNYIKAQDRNFRFTFDPNLNAEHQFTFRGDVIFRSVVEDLFTYHGLKHAHKVLFAGSSAGGIGVMNHAKWLQQKLRQSASRHSQLLTLMDSSWFIDYHGSISDQFAPDEIRELAKKGEIVETCAEDDPQSCISAHSLLSDSRLYPQDIPTLVIFSRFDLYLLTMFLDKLPSTDVIGIMRVVEEYTGSMNTSLHNTVMSINKRLGNLSYYITSCFQHVYFATSTLWGEGQLFGSEDIGVSFENNRFRHSVSSGYWKSYHLHHLNSTTLKTNDITIQMAIHAWIEASQLGGTVKFQDKCDGPRCNSQCPETVVLGELSPYWNVHFQFNILGVVVFVSLLCLMLKVGLSVYIKMIERQQNRFLKWNYYNKYEDSESVLPFCQDEDAISVACLNLRYSVTVSKSALKRAKTPIQRKRLLSVAAAIDDEESEGVREEKGTIGAWREEGGEDKIGHDEEESGVKVVRLDSETGQTILSKESDFAATIHQFQQLHAKRQKQQHGHGGGWKHRIHRRHQPTLHRRDRGRKKEIIKGVSTYFNPGELVAIMGPSGSGKTTFLDLLAGRRRGDSYQGEILVNGIPVDKVHDWYVANTGYVLQLAAPYYEELTVRENLTLASQMRLPKTLSLSEKLDHVEKVMRETGLTTMASTPVGGNTGTGLSGGQKRRLCVALQLLSMPSLIFLDEPTSGLDASSSLELLTHLHRVASSNRAVILTIHQPRLEIFHMFDKIMLLCQGQVAYHGIPDKAYEVFLDAHKYNSLTRRSNALDSKNPADVIMDMLGSEEERMAILTFYQESDEPQAVENAIEEVCNSVDEENIQQRRRTTNTAGGMNRLGALEARATKRAKLGQTLYLPVIFIGYGLLLGTVYLQTHDATSVLTGFGVFSCASALFMFPIIYSYLQKAIEIFTLEYADGVGHPGELILQTFARFSALALLPITASSAVIYLLAIPYDQYSFWVFLQTTVFTVSLNQTWVAMLVFVIAARPDYAHRISPVLSAVAGFVGGFFVPPKLMPEWYGWLFYINPNFYGFTAVSRVLLENFEVDCPYESDIECYPSSALYILSYFSLDTINPYLNAVVLLAMTLLYLLLAWTALTLRQSHVIPRLKKAIMTKWKPKRKDQSNITHSRKLKSKDKSTVTTSKEVSHFNLQTRPIHSLSLDIDPTHTQVTIEHDQGINERGGSINGARDGLKTESGSLLFKKVNVQKSEGEGESDENSTSPHTGGPGAGGGSLLSTNSATGDKRKVSFNDDVQLEGGEGAGSVGGAGLRRLLYRHRQTISKMLHDGENHEVWRPGMRRTRKVDSQEKESLNERRKSIFHRINTYRGGVGGASGEVGGASGSATGAACSKSKSKTPLAAAARVVKGGQKGKKTATSSAPQPPPSTGNCPTVDNIRRRMEQWRRIEEEALRQQEQEREEEEKEELQEQATTADGQQDVDNSEAVSGSPIECPSLNSPAGDKLSSPPPTTTREYPLPNRMRDIISLSEPSSPADLHEKNNIKFFSSLRGIPQAHKKGILKTSGNAIPMATDHVCISMERNSIGQSPQCVATHSNDSNRILDGLLRAITTSTCTSSALDSGYEPQSECGANTRKNAARLLRPASDGSSSHPVKVATETSNLSTHTNNTSALNKPFSCVTTPPGTCPPILKQPQEDISTKEVKWSDSQSTPSQSESPNHQLTPIPLSSTVHETRFIFPEVITKCDSDSDLDQSETFLHTNKAQDIKNSETMPSRYWEKSACITHAPQKRKLSSIALEMDPIVEEEELSPNSCVVDDVKSHSSIANKLDGPVSRSHGQLPVVKVELTTADCGPAHHSKTETLFSSTTQATTTTTTAQSQTMISPPTEPKMVPRQHGSTHCSGPQRCRVDNIKEDSLYEQSSPPPVVTTTTTSTAKTRGMPLLAMEDTLYGQHSPPPVVTATSNGHCSTGKARGTPGHGLSLIMDSATMRYSTHCSPRSHREDNHMEDTLCDHEQHSPPPAVTTTSYGHCSTTKVRGMPVRIVEDILYEQPSPPPIIITTSTSYGHCSTRGMAGLGLSKDGTSVRFSHSITHAELSTNKAGVHSRSPASDRAKTHRELQSKDGYEASGGEPSQGIIAYERLPKVASSPKEDVCVATGKLRLETGNDSESNSTPHRRQLEDDLGHEFKPCSQTSSPMQHKLKLDHPPRPALIKLNQQNRGSVQSSLHESKERCAYMYYNSSAHRWQFTASGQHNNSPSSIPEMVSVSQYQPGNHTAESCTGSDEPIDYVEASARKQLVLEEQQEGPGVKPVTRRSNFNSVVGTEQPQYAHVPCTSKPDKPRLCLMNECSSDHSQTNAGIYRSIDGCNGGAQLQGGTSKCEIPRSTSVQKGSSEATSDCNYGNYRGIPIAIDVHDGWIEQEMLPIANLRRSAHPPLTNMKQDIRSQLTTSPPNIGVVGGNVQIVTEQSPKVCAEQLTKYDERGIYGCREVAVGEKGSNWQTFEASSKTPIPASTTCFKMALKTKGDDCDQTSTNENPTLIRLGAMDANTLLCNHIHVHESMHALTGQEVNSGSHRLSRVGGLPPDNSEDKNNKQTNYRDKISADYETSYHDPNAGGIQHHGNAGRAGICTVHNDEGDNPGNYHVEGYVLSPKLRPKMVAVLHNTTSRLSSQNTLQHQVQFCSNVGDEKTVSEITRKPGNWPSFKDDSCSTVADLIGTKYNISKTSNLSRNEDPLVYNLKGTNYSNEQESQEGLESVSLNPHPQISIPEVTNSEPVEHPSLMIGGLVPAQCKPPGMPTHTHNYSHPPDALPNASSQESEQNILGKAITGDNSPPPKTGKINHNTIRGSFHAPNCAARQPPVGRVAADYANMTTCSEPLLAANSKLKSLKRLPSHFNKPHTNADRPSPIKYMQTDI